MLPVHPMPPVLPYAPLRSTRSPLRPFTLSYAPVTLPWWTFLAGRGGHLFDGVVTAATVSRVAAARVKAATLRTFTYTYKEIVYLLVTVAPSCDRR